MKRFLSAAALVALTLALAGGATAGVQRTFVSGFGSNANPCSRTEPCRTFGAAIVQTQPGGEVIALDSAGYGPVTITQAISLIAPPGIYAGITTTTPNTDAITVSAGPNDVVVLKGLSLSGVGLGVHGVLFQSGKALRVEGLTISGFIGAGIHFDVAATSVLSVSDTLVRDNGDFGIRTWADPGEVRGTINRTTLQGNNGGLYVGAGGRLTVRDTLAANNEVWGFRVDGPGTAVNVENSLATGNGYGIHSFHAFVRVAGTTLTENLLGILAEGAGGIFSRGNNTVEGNSYGHDFTALFAAK